MRFDVLCRPSCSIALRRNAALTAVVLVLGAAAGGCERKTPQTDAPTAAPIVIASTPGAAAQRAQELSEIADLIDPGRQTPLSETLPDWLGGAIGVEPGETDVAALRKQADRELAAFVAVTESDGSNSGALLSAVLALARSAMYSERAAANGSADAATLARLERVYHFMDVPMLSGDRNLFSQLFQMFVGAAAAQGHISDARQAEALGSALFGAVGRAGPLHRRTLALLLRADPDHEAVPQALQDAAAAIGATDDTLAVRMATVAVQMRADEVRVKDLTQLADLCHRALELDCGGRALAKATMLAGQRKVAVKGTDADEAALRGSTHTAELAGRVVALSDSAKLDDRIERARGLLRLERADEAKAAFESLRRDAPKDARPVAGLAEHAVQTRLDLQTANEIIDGAGPLENADAPYYEIAIGTRATSLVGSVVPLAMKDDWISAMAVLTPMLARMKADIDGYEAIGASDGRYLRFVFELTMEVLPMAQAGEQAQMVALLRGLLPRAVAVHREIPNNPHAYRSMLAATQFSLDRDAAFVAAKTPATAVVMGKDEEAAKLRAELQLRQIQALVDLAVSWDDVEIALAGRAMAQAFDGEKTSAVGKALADAHAVATRMSGSGDWAAVAQEYRVALGEPMQASDAGALNNYGIALAESGDVAAALPILERAAKLGTPTDGSEAGWGDVARLNLLVLRKRAGDTEAIAGLGISGGAKDVRLAALSWTAASLDDRKARLRAERALTDAAKKEAKDYLRPRLGPGRAGVILEGNLQVGLGYSTRGGLEIQLDSEGVVWLTQPPPVPIVDPRAGKSRAGKRKR